MLGYAQWEYPYYRISSQESSASSEYEHFGSTQI